LSVSRLVEYKRVDLVIEAFNKLEWPLIVIGDGRERKRLTQMAANNIRFIRSVTDAGGRYYKHGGRLFLQDEDFGIAAVEAQAASI
jgi:glycosyltransferase involved in cell wall biosynthesis